VHSGTANASSGGLFAYHGAAVSQLYRDTVAIIANGDASEGIILNPTAPGSRIRLVTGITQLSVGNSVDILGDLNVSRVISGDGSGLTNLPIAGVGTNLNVWNLKATNNVAAASMTLGGTTISNWPSGGGSGDVTGPPSSVFRGIPEFADTTGKRLTNSWISSDEASASVVISNTAPVLKLVATNNSSGARLNIVGGGGNILRIQTNGVTVVDIRPDNIRKYLNEVINPSGGISGARFWADDGKWSVPLVRKVRTNEVAVIARSNYIDATLVNLQLARQQATNALANWLSLTPTQKDFAQYRTIEVLAEVVKLMEILMLEKRDDLFELGLDEPFPQPPTPPVPDP
jgi:hypothetical protein